jgi:hypothetical protein
MAETFGIASGAAGVISLALQITHGLFDYYTAWRDQDQDIDSLLTSINNFSGLLTHINIKIQSPAQYDLEAKMGVEKSIQDASHNVKQLQSELERIKTDEPYPRSGVRSKIRHHVRKMKYPFRAETLAKIKTNISESRSNLSLAMEVLQVYGLTRCPHRGTWLIDIHFLVQRFRRLFRNSIQSYDGKKVLIVANSQPVQVGYR